MKQTPSDVIRRLYGSESMLKCGSGASPGRARAAPWLQPIAGAKSPQSGAGQRKQSASVHVQPSPARLTHDRLQVCCGSASFL
jgi:hypothetical protein